MTKNTTFIYIFTLLLSIQFVSCNGPEAESKKKVTAKKPIVNVPAFNADSAYQFIADQVAFGPRVPNTKAHQEAAVYLENTLRRFTKDVSVQSFQMRAYDGTVLNGKNIIGHFNVNAKKRILLASHWDSRPYADHDPNEEMHRTPIDGANDGASGVGVLLELARLFSEQSPSVGVDIILFDLEDYGVPN
ncbi:MAG: M28 family peptidase, partial [Bacteroidales bacterium]|nr:M28 family peptidase [Bacteroidales bacterium]